MPGKITKPIAGPPIKPWCYRVGRTASKKFGARENWPAERRAALRMGGADGRVARLEPLR